MYGSKKFVPSVVVGLRVQRTATTFVIRRYLRKSFEGMEVLSKVLSYFRKYTYFRSCTSRNRYGSTGVSILESTSVLPYVALLYRRTLVTGTFSYVAMYFRTM